MDTTMPSDWYVPIIVIGLIVLIVAFSGRSKAEIDESDEPGTGVDLIERLQRTLGIAIVVDSVESVESTDAPPGGSADAVTIRATFMSGRNTTSVAVGGPTESDAWAALARAAIAWRNSDYQHIPIWHGGG
jgi:hypothetical protein